MTRRKASDALDLGATRRWSDAGAELSMGWVDPWVGLGRVEIFQFLVGWIGSTAAKVLKLERIMLLNLKHDETRFGCTKQLNLLVVVCWVGLGQSVDGLGWIGSDEMDALDLALAQLMVDTTLMSVT